MIKQNTNIGDFKVTKLKTVERIDRLCDAVTMRRHFMLNSAKKKANRIRKSERRIYKIIEEIEAM